MKKLIKMGVVGVVLAMGLEMAGLTVYGQRPRGLPDSILASASASGEVQTTIDISNSVSTESKVDADFMVKLMWPSGTVIPLVQPKWCPDMNNGDGAYYQSFENRSFDLPVNSVISITDTVNSIDVCSMTINQDMLNTLLQGNAVPITGSPYSMQFINGQLLIQ